MTSFNNNQDRTEFFNVDKYGQFHIISQLEDNLKSFLDYAFLKIGAFTNVTRTGSTLYGGNFYTLNNISDPAYSANTVYEASRRDWVWDTGVYYSGISPINISGVYVNNNLIPAPTGNVQYPYTIDYPSGRVIFAASLQSTDVVTIEYSFRNVQIYKSNESFWIREIQAASYDPTQFSNINTILSSYKAQMPLILIELIPGTELIPYEIGSPFNIIRQDLMLHILTEKYIDRSFIVDILLNQKDRCISLYDIQSIVADNKYPLKYDGSRNSNFANYRQIIDNNQYFLRNCYFKKMNLIDLDFLTNTIFRASIRIQLEIYP